MVLLLLACAPKELEIAYGPEQPLDAVIIPGCPTKPDGTLSKCNWQRAIWGAKLWEDGVTEHFITSGGAVYNRYIEAEATKQGMVALGVPAEVIYTDTQALHTDENAAFSLQIAKELGFERLGAASHGGQAVGMRAFLRGWGYPAEALNMDLGYVASVERPPTRVEPVPEDEWLPLRQREKLIAERLDRARRPNSLLVYTWASISGLFGTPRPPIPPVPEPTLHGRRHRVDTRPWVTDVGRSEP